MGSSGTKPHYVPMAVLSTVNTLGKINSLDQPLNPVYRDAEERDMKASFVIPCYKSTEALAHLVAELTENARGSLESFEILLVRDSTDSQTTLLLDQLERDFQETRQIRLSRNFGQQAATIAGIAESAGEFIVTLDDDYQHQPSDAISMVEMLRENPDIQLVYARPIAPSDSAQRIRSGKLFRQILRLAGLDFAESLSPFRAFRGYLRGAFKSVNGPTVSVDVILSWVVTNVETVECQFKSREDGNSGYTKRALIKLAMGILLSYTTRPLRAGIYLGFGGVVLSLIYASVILARYFFGGIAVAGFATTTLLVLFIGSVQLLILGVLGVYMGEQHQRGMRQPAYFIQGHKPAPDAEKV